MTDTRDVYPTDPAFRAAPWRPAPTVWDQALEAARDDPTTDEFVDLLGSLPGVLVAVDGADERWRPTVVSVTMIDETARDHRTDDVVAIARRSGWRLEDVEWRRERLDFVRRGGVDG